MIIFNKIPYYFSSFFKILFMAKNPWALVSILRRKKTVLRLKNGLKISLSQPLDILILKETIVDDSYDLRGLSSVEKSADKSRKSPKKIIDIGGAMGDSALYAHYLYPDCYIDVFEPNPESFHILKENIYQNNAEHKVHIHKLAVGTQKKYEFYVSTYNVRSSVIRDEYSVRKISVKGTRLENYIDTQIDLLKIDTEGSELDILASIQPATFKKIKKIILEYHNHLVDNQDKKIIEFLDALGDKTHGVYRIKQIPDPYNKNIGYIVAEH